MHQTGALQNPDVERIIERIRGLRQERKLDEAEAAGKAGIHDHPADPDILSEHAETAVRGKNWRSATDRLNRLIGMREPTPERDAAVVRLAGVYVGLGQPGEAGTVLEKALASRPASLVLRKAEAELGLLDPVKRYDGGQWKALAASPELVSADYSTRVSVIAACVSGLRLAGLRDEAKVLLEENFPPLVSLWSELVKDGYGRLVIFDNGRTRVEFHTKLFDPATGHIAAPKRLAITFDVMEQTWEKEPFAYRPLSPRPIDILAVRKRTKDDFHQDLRREDFLRFAGPLASRYSDVVSLGQSLGAYSALYYASWLPGCRILATAPRNPLHPKYAGKRYASYKLFTHEYEMPVNNVSSPTIVYDPKNPEDATYVEQSLSVRFPKAKLIPYPNCGHSITRYLRDVGVLKSATLGFCKGIAFPPFDRSLRRGSAEYLRNLARLNLRAGRRNRALALARKALELGGDKERTEELLAKINRAAVSANQA